jgi:hypothetical protein
LSRCRSGSDLFFSERGDALPREQVRSLTNAELAALEFTEKTSGEVHSLWLDSSEPDHLAQFFCFVSDQLPNITGDPGNAP